MTTLRAPLEVIWRPEQPMPEAWKRFFEAVAGAANIALAVGQEVPNTREVNAGAGLQGGGTLEANVALRLYDTVATVADLPTTGNAVGNWAYALNGRNSGEGGGAGTGCPVQWSGTIWRIPGISTAVAA